MSEFYGLDVHRYRVHGWSMKRLPFEPLGWLEDYRGDLRQALRSMTPVPGMHLRAVYASPDREFADVENVLLYNVGSGSYGHLTGSGIEVLRTSSPDSNHHLDYRLTTDWGNEISGGTLLARLSIDALPPERGKPGSWWAATCDRVRIAGNEAASEYTIPIRVRDQLPTILSSVKPLLDGLTSALHVHDGTHPAQVQAALARYGDPDLLWARLNDPATSILGRRTLVPTPPRRNLLEPSRRALPRIQHHGRPHPAAASSHRALSNLIREEGRDEPASQRRVPSRSTRQCIPPPLTHGAGQESGCTISARRDSLAAYGAPIVGGLSSARLRPCSVFRL